MNFSSTLRLQHALNPGSSMLSAISKCFKNLMMILAIMVAPIIVSAQNEIVTENAKPGNPASEWDIEGRGDITIQGFSTDISVDLGKTIFFKIKTNAAAYTIDIFRLGYYNGLGARKWGSGSITAKLPQIQPADLFDPVTGKTDCNNWGISAKWTVPLNAVSGVYVAKLTRPDTKGSSHITFIVRDDDGNSDVLFKTSDATWQAYNNYGGTSLYGNIFLNDPPFIPVPGYQHATKVSYNRPLYSAKFGRDCFKSAEYPMVRWLERNGYDVSYATSVDFARDSKQITPRSHKAIFAVGHDEYWSASERKKFEDARNAGVNLGFFSGNTCFWKTRWEDNYRTLVCYKEGNETQTDILVCGGKCDISTNEWTGLWRSGCQYPSGGACLPENGLVGQIGSIESNAAIQVPDNLKNFRFWRNTSITGLATGQTATLSNSTIGFECEVEMYSNVLYGGDNLNFASSYPSGRVILSNTNVSGLTHKVSLFKFSSGALVFGAGTIQWSWGLDDTHERGTSVPDVRMQQATINLLADMGFQPGSIQSGLIAATASTDNIAPKSIINANVESDVISVDKLETIYGTASDVGGVVAGVEVSLDGGSTWKIANGTTNWSYNWIPTSEGTFNIKTRSFDDIGNVEINNNTAANSKTVTVLPKDCPCMVFQPTDEPTGSQNDGRAAEVGFKFKTRQDGVITKIRFYKKAGTGGIHIGNLWTREGVKLGSVTFTNETDGGWQEATFSSPIAITRATTYVASTYIESGDYVFTRPFFDSYTPRANHPVIALKDGEDGSNGVGEYADNGSVFPTSTYLTSNYFIDVVFDTKGPLVNQDPESAKVCVGSLVSFSSKAGGKKPITVKWQKSVDGIIWTDIQGAILPDVSFTVAQGDIGSQVRAVWTNSKGTSYSASASITLGDPINVSIATVINESCAKNDGSIAINASGGVAPYSYSLNGGNYQSSNTFNNLTAGTYIVNVKDLKSCSGIITGIIIVQANTLTSQLTQVNDAVCGQSNGSLTVTASGGTPPYLYVVSNGKYQSTGYFTNLSSGTYNVWVIDSKNCISYLPGIPINEISNMVVSADIISESCQGNDGKININVVGGNGGYKYSLNGGKTQSGNSFKNLPAGSYSILVTDSKGCPGTLTVELTQIPFVAFASNVTGESCLRNDGSITVSSTGGSPNYQYSINGGKFEKYKNEVIKGLSAGDYNITVKDENKCYVSLPLIKIGYDCNSRSSGSNYVVEYSSKNQPVEQKNIDLEKSVLVQKVAISPNPSNGAFKVMLTGYNGLKVNIRILDAVGREVNSQQVKVTSNYMTVPINMSTHSKGLHFVNIVSDVKSTLEKVLIN